MHLQCPHGRDEDEMNAHFRKAVAAIRRLRREPLLIERRRYPPKHEMWTQERGDGPRPADWPGIFEEWN